MHLADSLKQSDLIIPGNQTHNLGLASAILYTTWRSEGFFGKLKAMTSKEPMTSDCTLLEGRKDALEN